MTIQAHPKYLEQGRKEADKSYKKLMEKFETAYPGQGAEILDRLTQRIEMLFEMDTGTPRPLDETKR